MLTAAAAAMLLVGGVASAQLAAPAKSPSAQPAEAPKAAPGGIDLEQANQLLEVLQVYSPNLAERLAALKEQDAEQFRAAAGRIYGRFASLVRLKRTDPEAFALSVEQYRLQKQIDDATIRLRKQPEQRDSIVSELRNLFDQQSVSRLRTREHELSQLEKRLENLSQNITQQEQKTAKLVDRRVDDLLKGKVNLGPTVRLAAPPRKQDMVVNASPNRSPKPAPAPAPRPDAGTPGPAGDRSVGVAPPGNTAPASASQAPAERQIDQIIEVIRAAQPAVADRLAELRRDEPEAFDKIVSQLGSRFRMLVQKKNHDPEGFRLQVEEYRFNLEAMDLTVKMRQLPDAQAKKHEPELRNHVEQYFAARHDLLRHDLAQLEKRITDLRQELAEQRETREQTIQQRLDRVLASLK